MKFWCCCLGGRLTASDQWITFKSPKGVEENFASSCLLCSCNLYYSVVFLLSCRSKLWMYDILSRLRLSFYLGILQIWYPNFFFGCTFSSFWIWRYKLLLYGNSIAYGCQVLQKKISLRKQICWWKIKDKSSLALSETGWIFISFVRSNFFFLLSKFVFFYFSFRPWSKGQWHVCKGYTFDHSPVNLLALICWSLLIQYGGE